MEKAKKERRIPKSGEGRLRYQRGGPHALNVQTQEAQKVAEQLAEAAQRVPELLAGLQAYQQVSERLIAEDEVLAAFLLRHYARRKHIDHIQETLLIFRRKRALARIQAALAALSLAQELLAPDPLIPDLIALLQAGSTPTIQAEVDRERLTGAPRLLDTQLVQVKERLHAIQAALIQGNGWIEWQSVQRKRFRPIVVCYVIALNRQREDETPVPAELEQGIDPELAAIIQARADIPKHLEPLVYETISYGPYPFFRWREEGNGPIYAISLADISVQMPERFRMGGFFAIRRRRR